MTSTDLAWLVRLIAVWSGLAALAMAAQIAHVSVLLRPLQGPLPPSALVVPLAFGAASLIGVYGAYALWHRRRVGLHACVCSGTALLIGVAPAAILRGQALVLVALAVTLTGVVALISPPVRRLCSA
jgi:hypothetical protein